MTERLQAMAELSRGADKYYQLAFELGLSDNDAFHIAAESYADRRFDSAYDAHYELEDDEILETIMRHPASHKPKPKNSQAKVDRSEGAMVVYGLFPESLDDLDPDQGSDM